VDATKLRQIFNKLDGDLASLSIDFRHASGTIL